jgi:gliding motility-associated-like protein
MIGFEITEPGCFDQELGSIIVMPSGGVAPYTYSIDGTNFQSTSEFENLQNGVYQITSLDANDCAATEMISIHVPLSISVELGDDQIINLGDSAEIQAVVNLPFDSIASIQWHGIDSIDCPNCLTQIVAPIITTAYSVSVTTADGCADKDSVSVFVASDHDIYIPNIFSPNGDGINDVLTISAGDGVEQITSFEIFDRWGNLVFSVNNISSGSTSISWDGRFKGKEMNAGVFTYKMILTLKGEVGDFTELRYGDITLIR